MIWLITGATHTGKTVLAQRLMEKTHIPYLCLDHLKMGLIRAGAVKVTPTDELAHITAAVWPVAREMMRTAMENGQSLIVEGCYVPPDWKADFSMEQLGQMRCICLVMSEAYIRKNLQAIAAHACDIEQRMEDAIDAEQLLRENAFFAANFDEVYPITDEYARTFDALWRTL